MGLPAKQRTRRSKRERASHFALKKAALNKCKKCEKPVRPHHACTACGTYKGKTVMDTSKRAERTLRNKPRRS